MQKIIVNNFGPIKHAEIELRDFVVLIGEQASGKSTLAELFYFFKRLTKRFFWERENEVWLNRDSILQQFSNIVVNQFLEFYGTSEQNNNFNIIFFFDWERSVYISLSYSGKGEKPVAEWSEGASSILETLIAIAKDANIDKDNLILGGRSQTVLGENGQSYFKPEIISNTYYWRDLIQKFLSDPTLHSVYFPAERILETSFADYFPTAFQNYFQVNSNIFNQVGIVVMKDYLEHAGILKLMVRNHGSFSQLISNHQLTLPDANYTYITMASEASQKILKAEYRIVTDQEYLSVKDDLGEVAVQVKDASSGQKEVLRILQDVILVLSNSISEGDMGLNYSVSRVIEEPEAHLFPTAQKLLVELFSLVSNVTRSQIFITTHSPYILTVLSNLLYAQRIYDFDSSKENEIEEKTGIHRKTWLDKNNFSAYALNGGNAISIFDRDETGLISQNYLDKVSEDLGREFQVLHNMRLKQIREMNKK
jgi:energy-coupling factor transporter ATP-binding protein EcfA2